MNNKFIKDFADKHKLPEFSIKNIFIQSLSLAATNKFKEYDYVEFDIDSENFVCYRENQIVNKPIKEIGRRFLMINCEIYFKYLLNAVYPEIFKFNGNVTETIKDIYESKNNGKYSYEKYDDGPYCSACMQAPCMCSDREQSSSLWDF